MVQLELELDGLRRAVRNRAVIEQAVGVLVVLKRCSPRDAFRALVRISQQHNVKLRRVARALVDVAARTGGEDMVEHLDQLLRSRDDAGPETVPAPQQVGPVLAAARRLAQQGQSEEATDHALRALYDALVDQGWIPPYDPNMP